MIPCTSGSSFSPSITRSISPISTTAGPDPTRCTSTRIPVSAPARSFPRTYDAEAASSPASTTASRGSSPSPSISSVCAAKPSRISPAIAPPSMIAALTNASLSPDAPTRPRYVRDHRSSGQTSRFTASTCRKYWSTAICPSRS